MTTSETILIALAALAFITYRQTRWVPVTISKLLRMPAFPVVPYPPFVPLVPLPVKYRVYFGEPMSFQGDPDDDDDVLDTQVKQVRHRIQAMIHQGLRERQHVFW